MLNIIPVFPAIHSLSAFYSVKPFLSGACGATVKLSK
jgi:hypothetical protein